MSNNLQSSLGTALNVLPVSQGAQDEETRKTIAPPKIPAGMEKLPSFQYEQQFIEPLHKQQLDLSKNIGKTQAAIKASELEVENNIAKGKAEIATEFAKKARETTEKAEQQQDQWPDPSFHPTQENAQSLGELFSLVSTMGVMLGSSGKMSAMNALGAMKIGRAHV